MVFDPILAEKRFGYGLSPELTPPQTTDEMLKAVAAPDAITETLPIEPFSQFRNRMVQAGELRKDLKKHRGTEAGKRLQKQIRLVKKEARQAHARWLTQTLMRRSWTRHGFRERLVAFWADHFTAQGKAGVLKRGTSPYIEEAIRPHVAGRFADMLYAVSTSPLMVHYLDQEYSMGPNSVRAQKRGRQAGLNENLAREILELHTLGVGAGYSQADVRQLAELLTGVTYDAKQGTKFRKDFAEPGAEQVLGRSYGGGKNPSLQDVKAVLDDLAVHPATARHLAKKLAIHFVSDNPDPALISALEQSFRDSGGELMPLYDVLLSHPSAWQSDLLNLKMPDEFVASTMRALAIPPQRFSLFKNEDQHEKFVRRVFLNPFRLMGQPWQSPLGPDGWPEEDDAWLTPQGLAARVSWALMAPTKLRKALPDPRDFVRHALGPTAPDAVQFAAGAAESRREGIALVLSSPAFQRK